LSDTEIGFANNSEQTDGINSALLQIIDYLFGCIITDNLDFDTDFDYFLVHSNKMVVNTH
jgi:hypothetical protein